MATSRLASQGGHDPSSDAEHESKRRRGWSQLALLAIILGIGLALRVYNIDFGLPDLYHSDETFLVMHALKFGQGDLNPGWFLYPSLIMYSLFFLYSLFFVAGWATGLFTVPFDIAILYFTDPTAFYLIGRITTAILGTLTLFVTYLIGARLHSRAVGLLGASFLAVLPIHVEESHYIKPDVPMTFFVTLALWASAMILRRSGVRWYLLAGLLAGLAASTKYPGGLIIVAPMIAHLLGAKPHPWRDLGLLLGIAPIGFFLATPFAALDFPTFWSFIQGQIEQGREGWLSAREWTPYLDVLTRFFPRGIGVPLELLAVAGLLYALLRRSAEGLLLASYVLFFFLVLGLPQLNWPRYWNPVLPGLSLLAAILLIDLGRCALLRPPIRLATFTVFLLVLVIPPFWSSVRFDHRLGQQDTRQTSKEWVLANIPLGSKLAITDVGPQLNQTHVALAEQFVLETLGDATDQETETYKRTPAESRVNKRAFYEVRSQVPVQEPSYHAVYLTTPANVPLTYYITNGYEYAIVSGSKRWHYLRQPERFPTAAHFFDELDRAHELIAQFTPDSGPGPEIIVYRLRQGET